MLGQLPQLREELTWFQSGTPDAPPLSNVGIYRCCRPQKVSGVPIHQPTMLLVVRGRKEIATDSRSLVAKPGEILLIPAQTTFWVGNYPDDDGDLYQGIALGFSSQTLDQFRSIYGTELARWDMSSRWHAKAPKSMMAALGQWLQWARSYPMDDALIQHRQIEILLLLARAGLAGNLLLGGHGQWRERVTQMLALDPARPWQIGEICHRLGCSESSLRRRLRDEGTGFREILEEVRLAAGLSMLWQTYLPIGRIAEATGYLSQSRFSERFKRRFGLTPTELRRTQTDDGGEKLTVSGE